MNLIPIKQLQPLLSQLNPAVNGIQSQNFGRRLYHLQYDSDQFWLKLQLENHSQIHEGSFHHELKMYQLLFKQAPQLIAPTQIFSLAEHELKDCMSIEGATSSWIKSILCIQNVEPLFDQNPNYMNRQQIIHTLLNSINILENLHELGFIHGDLKPMHFRVHQNRAVLIDFEQAFHYSKVEYQANTATPHYMAPELFHGEAKSFATDIYALGVIWMEWFAQQKFKQKSYLDWAKLHCQHLKIELSEPFKGFEMVLSLMLAKDKANRCTNFYQIKQILNNNVY